MKFKRKLIFMALFAAMGQVVQAQDKVVQVADFDAIPNDGKCDIAAIKRALDYAKTVKAEELIFDAGTYDLFVGDASKNTAIDIMELHDFTCRGAVDNERSEEHTSELQS